MQSHTSKNSYSAAQLYALVTLRVFIGWYFLYEGLVKILNPNWTAYGYLKDSKGWFVGFFEFITNNDYIMQAVNQINIYGLILIGLFLITGFLAKAASIGAITLLSLFYLSHPPLLEAIYILPSEGSYLWIDRNLIMLVAVVVLVLFPTSKHIGLDRIVFKKQEE